MNIKLESFRLDFSRFYTRLYSLLLYFLPYHLRCLILAFHPGGSVRKWCYEFSVLFIVKLVLGSDQEPNELYCVITRHEPTQPHYQLQSVALRWCYKSE